MKLLRFLYNLAYPIGLIVLLPWLIRRMIQRGKYRHKFGQRFAVYSKRVQARLRPGDWTWVHAVSVGEGLIAMKLIRRLRERDPERRFVLSTTTSTGFVLANEQRCEWLEPIYNPLDFFLFTRRALDLIRPREIVLVEAEVWPNLVSQARHRGIPITLVNARLSPRSESRFRKFRILTAPIFNQLDRVCVQEPEDVARWQSLGVKPEKIVHTGSIKFDDGLAKARTSQDFKPLLQKLGVTPDAPILLAGSTHPGEEAALARIFLKLRDDHPGLFLIVVPRHVERAGQVREDLEAAGLSVANRSRLDVWNGGLPDALLVDSTGELRDWYACATAVFVGKSLLSKGGQNPAEPILAGAPVVVGPCMQNFAILMHGLLRADGIAQADSEPGIEARIRELLEDAALRKARVENGRKIIESHRGATDRTCVVIEALR